MNIPFNKPCIIGKEIHYIKDAIKRGKVSGDGYYSQKCHQFFQQKYGFPKVLLTNSCTDALEMSALLLDIKPGDEVIAPSYTFVSTVNAFVLRGAKIVFADSCSNNPNIDPIQIEKLINTKTKAILVVHYAGVACDMDKIMQVANKHKLFVVEDAAHAIDSYYKDRPLGSIGHLATFSFHETKNISCGEGGMIVINDKKFEKRAEIIREKGTNRSAFFRGEIDKYGWVDIGSSFLPSDITAAFLFAQLEKLDDVQKNRKKLWKKYYTELSPLSEAGKVQIPKIPKYATNNGHLFYLITKSEQDRNCLIKYLKSKGIHAVFHYLSLHKSQFYKKYQIDLKLVNADRFTNRLLRLPLYYNLTYSEQKYIIKEIYNYFYHNKS